MKQNLDTLRSEIQARLERESFAVFHGYSRMLDSLPIVYWDVERYPDYGSFLETAKAAGVRMMVFHQHEFSSEQVDHAIERLEECNLERDEYRAVERRIREMTVYDGFTCALELSFDFEGRIYVFDLRTDWYEDFTDLVDELQVLSSEPPDESDENPMSGYFSKN